VPAAEKTGTTVSHEAELEQLEKLFEVWILRPTPRELFKAIDQFRQVLDSPDPVEHYYVEFILSSFQATLLFGSRILEHTGANHPSWYRNLLSKAVEITHHHGGAVSAIVEKWATSVGALPAKGDRPSSP
jgi:hypothetical protein